MSSFSVTIKRIRDVTPHPTGDLLEVVHVEGYSCVEAKGRYRVDDLVAYIPGAAVLPEWLLKKLSFWSETRNIGRLDGTRGNRVKAIRIRGVVSEGLCYPVRASKGDDAETIETHGSPIPFNYIEVDAISTGVSGVVVYEGDDVSTAMGIEKYAPSVPVHLTGEVFNCGQTCTLAFDIQNIKNFPDGIQLGEEVVFTEKLHGTFTGVAVVPLEYAHPEAFGAKKNIYIYSKTLGALGLAFKNNAANKGLAYVLSTQPLLAALDALDFEPEEPITFVGETFGPNVQKGTMNYVKSLQFRLFGICDGFRDSTRFRNFEEVESTAKSLGVTTPPVLYRGPFSPAALLEHTSGKTQLSADHIREGLVVVPATERRLPDTGHRVCLKSVSEAYLLRNGGSEFN